MKHIEPLKDDPLWDVANKILDAVFQARVEGIRDDIQPPDLRYHQVNAIIEVLRPHLAELEEDLKNCQETLDSEFSTRPPGTTPTTAYTDQGKPYPGW